MKECVCERERAGAQLDVRDTYKRDEYNLINLIQLTEQEEDEVVLIIQRNGT